MRRACVAVLTLTVAAACTYTVRDVAPTVPEEAQSSRIYAADGSLLTVLHAEENRENVRIDEIPDHVRDAVIAIEDERFYRHKGVDLRAILRAARENTAAGEVAQGGSTITQQYVKLTLLQNDEDTLRRKIEEASLALQLERTYTKDKILELYLNAVYFGANAYGVEAAARQYFGKAIAKVTIAEAALLAGLIQAPSRTDPFRAPERALARRNEVIERMRVNRFIDASKAARATRAPLRLGRPTAPAAKPYRAAYFVEEVKQWILDDPRFGATQEARRTLLFAGGLRIQTTVDPVLQRLAEQAAREVLPDPTGPAASLVAVDPETGFVRAMVGGRNFFGAGRNAKFNLATQGGRQAGSAFKPLVLASALERGVDLRNRYRAPGRLELSLGRNVEPWHVSNYGEGSAGVVTLEEATVKSFNTVYAQLILQVGTRVAMDTASRLGIRSRLDAFPAAVLGSNDVTAVDMASAYATLANRGVHVPPVLVTRITRPDGSVLYAHEPVETRVLRTEVADTVTGVLRQVIERGTGTRADIGRPAAGKTGTAQEWRDAWFAGYTPDLAAAVWVGFPQEQISMSPPRTPIRVTGGSYPAQIWQRFMRAALADVPPTPFPQPKPARGDKATTSTSTAARESTTTTSVAERPTRLVRVPDVRGRYATDAELALLRAGFAVQRIGVADRSVRLGRVVDQWPPVGVPGPARSIIVVFVNEREAAVRLVPHVLGLRRAEAVNRLERAGFEVEVVERPEPATVTARLWRDRVWRQTPPGASFAIAEATIRIWIDP